MYPDDLKYLDYHGWVRVEGEVGKIGVTYFGQEKMGEIIYVELPVKGRQLKQKDKLCTLESAKSVFDFPSPLSGMVIEANEKLNQEPSLINKDPYGEGWLVKMKISDLSEIEKLLNVSDYKKIVEEEKGK